MRGGIEVCELAFDHSRFFIQRLTEKRNTQKKEETKKRRKDDDDEDDNKPKKVKRVLKGGKKQTPAKATPIKDSKENKDPKDSKDSKDPKGKKTAETRREKKNTAITENGDVIDLHALLRLHRCVIEKLDSALITYDWDTIGKFADVVDFDGTFFFWM
jgi:hypothetical protein